MRAPREDADGGFMLVELLVVISLMAIVGGLLSDAIISAFHSQRDITARAANLNSLRQAMERTTRDMRSADAICGATSQLLELEVPTASGGTQLLSWTVVTSNGITSLIESQSAENTQCQPTGTPAMTTVVGNLDASATLFGYYPKPGYTPLAVGTVDSFCQQVANPGSYETHCIGVVGIDLKALLPGHPDMELADTVQLRNVT